MKPALLGPVNWGRLYPRTGDKHTVWQLSYKVHRTAIAIRIDVNRELNFVDRGYEVKCRRRRFFINV